MADAEDAADLSRLIETLEEMSAILERGGQSHWVEWLSGDVVRLRRDDRRGAAHYLEALGGMGSLNDVFLARSEDRERFDELRRAASDGARRLLRAAGD